MLLKWDLGRLPTPEDAAVIAASMAATLAFLGGGPYGGPPTHEDPLPLPEKLRGVDTQYSSGNETAAQLEGRHAAQFGSGKETATQLKGWQAAQFGSGNETAAQLEGRRRGGRKRLKQTNPVYYLGRAMHPGCRKWITIEEAVAWCGASTARRPPKSAFRSGACRR